MISRRTFLKTFGLAGASLMALGGYAFGVEPHLRLAVTRYTLPLPGWRGRDRLRVALVADIHAVDPWMSVAAIERIVETTNGLGADLILLLGDYVGTMRLSRRPLEPSEWAPVLGRLAAPLGTFAILGNHDWWWTGDPAPIRAALERAGIPVLVNDAVRLAHGGRPFWLTGTDSMAAVRVRGGYLDKSDLRRTLAKVTDAAPILHMAHEPDLFVDIPRRVALTVSGHTHGGQVRLPGWGPLVVPSFYGPRFAYGHVVEDGRHLVVSGGLGCSGLPVRFLCTPEIVLLDVTSDDVPRPTASGTRENADTASKLLFS